MFAFFSVSHTRTRKIAKKTSSQNQSQTKKPGYLEPISGSLQKTIEEAIAIGLFHNQRHDEKGIRDASIQNYLKFLYKRGYRLFHAIELHVPRKIGKSKCECFAEYTELRVD
jgi:hypothetical protein